MTSHGYLCRSKMMARNFYPGSCFFTGLLLCIVTKETTSSPKGGAAVFGGGGGRPAEVSDQWGVLSTPTKVLVYIFWIIIAILFLVGMYRLYKWCKREIEGDDPRAEKIKDVDLQRKSINC